MKQFLSVINRFVIYTNILLITTKLYSYLDVLISISDLRQKKLFYSSCGSCHGSDVTWQEIGRTCGSVYSCLIERHPSSRICTASLIRLVALSVTFNLCENLFNVYRSSWPSPMTKLPEVFRAKFAATSRISTNPAVLKHFTLELALLIGYIRNI